MREQGTAAIELSLGVLVLVIPVALLVLSFGPTLERRVLARSLATEIARVIVHNDGDVSAHERDRLMGFARTAGVDPASVRVGVCEQSSRPLPDLQGCRPERRAEVIVTVEVAVRPQLLPGGPDDVSYTHTEPVDPYRSRP